MNRPATNKVESLASNRSEYLQALTTSPRSKRELVELLDCSRSTVDRVLRSLADAYLVEYNDGKWHATAVGICAYRRHESYTGFIEDLADASLILTELPPENPVDDRFLTRSTPHASAEAVPDAVLAPMFASVREASTVRGLVPRALAGSAADFYDFATSGDSSDLELIIADTVFDQLYEIYPEDMNGALEDPNATFLRGEVSVPYGLWISDTDEVGIVVYSEKGLQGTILNDTEAAVEWATEQYDSIKQDAEEIFLRGGVQRIR